MCSAWCSRPVKGCAANRRSIAIPSGTEFFPDIAAMLADQPGRRPSRALLSTRGEAVIVGIDGTPAVREMATGTEVYARSIIEALAVSKGDRTLRVYANASHPPPWLPTTVEWRGIPF